MFTKHGSVCLHNPRVLWQFQVASIAPHVVLEQFLGSFWNLRKKLRAPRCYMDHVDSKYQFSSNSVYIQNLLHRNLATLDFYYWILDIIRIKQKLYFWQGERPYINAMHLVSLVNDIDYWQNLQVLRAPPYLLFQLPPLSSRKRSVRL